MRKTTASKLTVALLVPLALMACWRSTPSFRGTALNPPRAALDFTLTDADGQPFQLSHQRGKVVLLFFGYTHCPDVCPTTLAMWRQVYDALGDDADRVRFVFITVDPQRDTPEWLKVHLQAFNPKFIGLTGSPEELEKAYQAFGVFQEKDTTSETAAGYLVTHTASSFLVDPEGQWRERLSYGTPMEDIVHDVRAVLE